MHAPPDESFELFRRAIAERDQVAWEAIHARYRLLLIAWARQSSVHLTLAEPFEDIADQAIARAWAALNPMRFNEFPGLAAVLAYLRSCVSAVMIDLARAQSSRERALQRLTLSDHPTPEQIVLDGMVNSALWELVNGLVGSPQEAAILRQNIVLGQPPRVLLARRPDLFGTIDDVYTAKRNFINRLQRNRDLQRLFAEISAE